MKKTLLILTTILSVIFSFGQSQNQKLIFQGKLLENQQPANGLKTFAFQIKFPNSIWAEAHTNVPVIDGIYMITLGVDTPFPQMPFANQDSLLLYVSVEGNALDTVVLYPDWTVPPELRNGVSWFEVQNKPTVIDLDTLNEIQQLGLSQDTVILSAGGGYIVLSDARFSSLSIGDKDSTVKNISSQGLSGNFFQTDSVW